MGELSTVLPHGLQIAGGSDSTMRHLMQDEHVWKQLVKNYILPVPHHNMIFFHIWR